ncbi:hypothetical protein V8E36_005398 [Tilletia maclaganii]
MSFRRSLSKSSFSGGGDGGSNSAGSSSKPSLKGWLNKTNALLEQITNAPGARPELDEEDARAAEEAERVRCQKCGVVFADKLMLKQHFVLMPRHNPNYSGGTGPEFPSASSSAARRSMIHSHSAPTFDQHFHDQHADHDDDDGRLISDERTRFATQFTPLPSSMYERDIVIRADHQLDRKAGGLGTKSVIGPGQGMTYVPGSEPQVIKRNAGPGNAAHARTVSLAIPPLPGARLASGSPGNSPAAHSRSYSVDTGSSNNVIMGFDDDFMSDPAPATQRAPLDRSATEPALHFSTIAERDDDDHDIDDGNDHTPVYSSDEDDHDDSRRLERLHTPSLEWQRRDSVESHDTYLATPAQPASHDLIDDGDEPVDHDSRADHTDDDGETGTTASQLRGLLLDGSPLAPSADNTGKELPNDDQASAFDLAFAEAGLDQPFEGTTASPAAPVAPSRVASAKRLSTFSRPAPAIPTSTLKSSLASRPAPPPPPPPPAGAAGRTSLSLASRKLPAPPPTQGLVEAKGPPAPAPAPTALPSIPHSGKKKRAPPPPPPPRRSTSTAASGQ